MTGCLQTSLKQLSKATKASYRAIAEASIKQFKPEEKQELHIVKLQMGRKVCRKRVG